MKYHEDINKDIHFIYFNLFNLLWSTGSFKLHGVFVESVNQLSHPGLTVMLECSMGPGFSMSSYTMLWYRQKHYRAPLEFLLTEYDQSEGHFQLNIHGAKNNFSLRITDLYFNDSSTYYCAARHTGWGKERGENRKDFRFLYDGFAPWGQGGTVIQPHRAAVQKPPPIKSYCKKTLVCVAKDFYPDHVSVSWKIENGDDNIGEATDTAALRTGDSYTITSRLRVSAKTWFIPTNVFTCNVTFFDGEKYSHYTNSINGEEGMLIW
uniref:Ig-like domain-containing protein n=1 Tax=Anabas testudineus TaxID=64144 RepID=A0A3Q1J3F5_ANATE